MELYSKKAVSDANEITKQKSLGVYIYVKNSHVILKKILSSTCLQFATKAAMFTESIFSVDYCSHQNLGC